MQKKNCDGIIFIESIEINESMSIKGIQFEFSDFFSLVERRILSHSDFLTYVQNIQQMSYIFSTYSAQKKTLNYALNLHCRMNPDK